MTTSFLNDYICGSWPKFKSAFRQRLIKKTGKFMNSHARNFLESKMVSGDNDLLSKISKLDRFQENNRTVNPTFFDFTLTEKIMILTVVSDPG